MQKLKLLLISLIILIPLNSCSLQKTVYKIPTLTYTKRADLPPVNFIVQKKPSLICLDTKQAQNLYLREQLLLTHITQLETLIEKTNTAFGIPNEQ